MSADQVRREIVCVCEGPPTTMVPLALTVMAFTDPPTNSVSGSKSPSRRVVHRPSRRQTHNVGPRGRRVREGATHQDFPRFAPQCVNHPRRRQGRRRRRKRGVQGSVRIQAANPWRAVPSTAVNPPPMSPSIALHRHAVTFVLPVNVVIGLKVGSTNPLVR